MHARQHNGPRCRLDWTFSLSCSYRTCSMVCSQCFVRSCPRYLLIHSSMLTKIDCGMTYRLSRLDGELGTFLALTGKRLDTTDIIRAGLATHFITLDSLQRFEQETGTNYNDSFSPYRENYHPRLERTLRISRLSHPRRHRQAPRERNSEARR